MITTWFDRLFANFVLEYFFEQRLAAPTIFQPPKKDGIAPDQTAYLGELAATLMANTFVVYAANLLIISVSALAAVQFTRIILTYKNVLLSLSIALTVWAVFVAYNANLMWIWKSEYHLETHFRQITLDRQIEIIQRFNQLSVPILPAEKQYTGHFNPTCRNKFCIETVGLVQWLYWLSLSLIILVAALGVMAGASAFSPFEIDTARSSRARRRKRVDDGVPDLDRDALEYRKRVGDLRSVLYYGSTSLAVAIVWIISQCRWGTSPFFTRVAHLEQFVSSVSVYLAVLYIVILGLAFLPPAMWLQEKLRRIYYKEIDKHGSADVVPFDKWLQRWGIDAGVLTTRDLFAFVAPLGSLLLSASVDFAALGKTFGAFH